MDRPKVGLCGNLGQTQKHAWISFPQIKTDIQPMLRAEKQCMPDELTSCQRRNQGQHYKNNIFTKVWAVGLLLEPEWFLFQPDELSPFLGLGS